MRFVGTLGLILVVGALAYAGMYRAISGFSYGFTAVIGFTGL